MNRTWAGIELFEDSGDYEAFERVLAEAVDREAGIRVCAYCLMPNHFHLAVWPKQDGQLSRCGKGVISFFASSAEFVGELRLRQASKLVI